MPGRGSFPAPAKRTRPQRSRRGWKGGGGCGLGQYIAEALSDAGARVVLCSRKKEALEEVKAEIEGRGGEALALSCDVMDPEDVDRTVAETEEAFGVIDVLVNNSGAGGGGAGG